VILIRLQVYEFLLGVPLFSHPPDIDPAEADQHHLAQMRASTGDELPPDFAIPLSVLERYPPAHFAHSFREKARALGMEEHDVDGAIDLMGRCLRIDPAERPNSIQLARESGWLVELGGGF
jgi:hypothetical protein